MNPEEKLHNIRHTLAHLLAASVLKKYPQAKLAIGPVIEHGFYYDIDFGKDAIGPADLKEFEKSMRHMVKQSLPMTGKEVSAADAKKLFKASPYKLELIKEYAGEGKTLTAYTVGEFTDLCKGGHVDNTNQVPGDAFALTHLAGAYWRGDEKNPQLTRIYSLAFNSKAELDSHLLMIEEAKKRDHRKLGKELELFTVIDEIGAGLPLFYPKGALLRRLVENFITEEQEKRGYVPIWIPHITKGKLYEISGHLQKYDAMYNPMKVDEDEYYLKPMNCPHFMMLYRSLPHSYRDLPMRWTSTTTNYRYEKSGELTGLIRVRALTQDDCHVFCTVEQIEGEIKIMLDMIKNVYGVFGFTDFYVRVSLRDSKQKDKYIGSEKAWNMAEDSLRTVIAQTGWKSVEEEGEAAFYGPKLDFMMKDAIGREWQLSTIQLDFNLPEKFELEYASSEGTKERPVVIHRAILGSTERFLGVYIEHTGGNFPLWLSPTQISVLSVGESHIGAGEKLVTALKNAGIRAELRAENESLGKKIREVKTSKTPLYIVLGDKEMSSGSYTVEARDNKKFEGLSEEKLIAFLNEHITKRSLSF